MAIPDTRPKTLKSKVKLFRYDPTKDERPHYEEFEVPYKEGSRIFSVLEYIREELGVDLARRTSCRMRICGQCAILVNGNPKLACWDEALPEMTIEPLPNFQVIRDLVIDRREYDRLIHGIAPLERLRSRQPTPNVITTSNFEKIPPSDTNPFGWKCIECLSCVSVCPVTEVAMGRFAGPAAITRLAQFAFDPRDKMTRMPDAFYANVYDCTTCRRCEEVCPVQLTMPNRMEVTIEKLRALMASEGIGPLPEHVAFQDEAIKTGRVIAKREKTLLESIPDIAKAK